MLTNQELFKYRVLGRVQGVGNTTVSGVRGVAGSSLVPVLISATHRLVTTMGTTAVIGTRTRAANECLRRLSEALQLMNN